MGKITLIGCPKLDHCDYSEKLTDIIRQNEIQSLTVIRMEVPLSLIHISVIKKLSGRESGFSIHFSTCACL